MQCSAPIKALVQGTLDVDEVDRVRRLTDRIDPLGAVDAPRFDRFNIHEALDRVRKLIGSSAPNVMIRERYDPSLPQARGDLDQLIQALLNVAKNAAEAVTEQNDGEIAISTSYRSGVKFRSAASGAARAQLEIQIVDNGPGLHPDVADRLFEAFATTKRDGMGLGLTVAADMIAATTGALKWKANPVAPPSKFYSPSIRTKPYERPHSPCRR